MGRILVIAEKPSVARDYARVLSCREKGDGCLLGGNYVVTWAVGHLVGLSEPEAYGEKYKRWNLSDLPIMPQTMTLQVLKGAFKQFQILKKWMNDPSVDSLICGTDSGREGELIFRYIYEKSGCKKPFQRLWVSSMTDEAIRAGLDALRDGGEFDALYASARSRSEADWLVGMNASRAYSVAYQAHLSIGRVQTPTLALIVKRQLQIEQFVPEDYYEVRLTHEGFQSTYFFLKEKERVTRIFSADEAEKIVARCKAAGEVAVLSVKKKAEKQLPPLLFDLTELQREGNRRYGYSASKVLQIAQSLYEKHKLLTYPRTDSKYLPEDMKETVRRTLHALNVPAFHDALMGIGKELVFTKRIIDNSKIRDHHALIPTPKKPDLEALSAEERRIYEMVALRLIAAFYPPYETENTEAILSVKDEEGEMTFLASGRRVIAPGFKALLGSEEGDGKKQLPELTKGQKLKISKAALEKKQTKPPKPYTEATLLSAMEYAGRELEDEAREALADLSMEQLSLGTPATRAAIIERLVKVEYIERKKKELFPTEKGRKLISVLPPELISAEMTGKWERALERISEGTMDPHRFRGSIERYVAFIVRSAHEKKPVEFEKPVFKPKRKASGARAAKSS